MNGLTSESRCCATWGGTSEAAQKTSNSLPRVHSLRTRTLWLISLNPSVATMRSLQRDLSEIAF